MTNWDWVQELAKAENALEETGSYEHPASLDTQVWLQKATLTFLSELKQGFLESVTAFNEWKTSPHGRIKLYGIAKTYADFMLFRNGFKMVFSQKAPGQISIRYNFLISNPLVSYPQDRSQNSLSPEEHLLQAQMSPFGDIQWTFQGSPVSKESIIRYHLTLFVKESSQ